MPNKRRPIAMAAALCLLMTLAVAAPCPAAMKTASAAQARIALPAEITDALSQPAWDGWAAVAINEEARVSPWNHAAVVMRRESRDVLVLLRREGGPFVPYLVTGLAVYQGGYTPRITLDEQYTNLPMTITYDAPPGGGGEERFVYAVDGESGWALTMILLGPLDENGEADLRIGVWPMKYDFPEPTPDGIHVERAFGEIHRRLWHFDITDFPHSLQEARHIVGPPAQLTAEGTQQDPLPTGAPWRLLTDAGVPVHSGPLSAADAPPQATLAGDAAIALLGFQGHMAMIGYDAGGRTAYGFVPIAAMDPTWEGTEDLRFAYLRGEMLKDADSLDGPGGGFVRALTAGDRVTYLATLGADWTYIEAEDGGRGFVRSDAVGIQYDLSGWHPDTSDEIKPRARVMRPTDLIDDPYRRLTPTVLAEIPVNTEVYFHDNLYGAWAYVEYKHSGGDQMGFVPRDAIEAVGDLQLEGNG